MIANNLLIHSKKFSLLVTKIVSKTERRTLNYYSGIKIAHDNLLQIYNILNSPQSYSSNSQLVLSIRIFSKGVAEHFSSQ